MLIIKKSFSAMLTSKFTFPLELSNGPRIRFIFDNFVLLREKRPLEMIDDGKNSHAFCKKTGFFPCVCHLPHFHYFPLIVSWRVEGKMALSEKRGNYPSFIQPPRTLYSHILPVLRIFDLISLRIVDKFSRIFYGKSASV